MGINFCAWEKISWYIHVTSAQTVKFVKGFSLESFHKTANHCQIFWLHYVKWSGKMREKL